MAIMQRNKGGTYCTKKSGTHGTWKQEAKTWKWDAVGWTTQGIVRNYINSARMYHIGMYYAVRCAAHSIVTCVLDGMVRFYIIVQVPTLLHNCTLTRRSPI